MGPLVYLAMAYAAFWIIAFVFIFSMYSRQRGLQRDLEQLEQLVDRSHSEH